MSANYETFLATKNPSFEGVSIEPVGGLSQKLFPFQRDIVEWALRRGRAAIFADCGLGKTPMQLEWSRHIPGNVLILAPLAVAHQTVEEGHKFGIEVSYCREQAEVKPGITIANYEMLEAFDPAAFSGIVLDESSILKAYDGRTRTRIIESFSRTPYRLACTATPAPNDHMELGNHAEFLGVMTRAEMLSMYFVHDGGETQKWRIKGHAEKRFWEWVCAWAVSLRKPSDLGYENDGFVLPPLTIKREIVRLPESAAARRGLLFNVEAKTLQERRDARRAGLEPRVARCAEIVASKPDEPWLIWCGLNDEGEALTAAIPEAIEITGADSVGLKSERMLGFARGDVRVLVTKAKIAGFGMNWQHCPNVIFCGMSDSFESYYQAVRRVWRFGQKRPVTCWIVTGDAESSVIENVIRKEKDAEIMADEMVRNMVIAGEIQATSRSVPSVDETTEKGGRWEMRRGDCIEALRAVATDSVHYTVFSPPFASLYTYSDSPRDMGNSRTHEEFYEHFRFLIPELLRVTMPGRLLSFHCMNLPTSKTRDGVIGLSDFRGLLIRAFTDAGWIYHSEVVIWKDPVTAMQRTKALGLLHKQIKKDSCMSRQGIPDYVVTMRKPGDNPERVTHTADEFPVSLWQRYASPIWMDINPNKTIQGRSAREERDERHICPLQLEVIERCLKLWSNPGDLVLSPFAGIGSEGYVALRMGRRFLGVELKDSYFREAVRNLRDAETSQHPLLAESE